MKKHKKVFKSLMISESNYPYDSRVKPEADKLTEYNYFVTVIATKEKDQKFYEVIDGVETFRIPEIDLFPKGTDNVKMNRSYISKLFKLFKSIIGYGFEYFYFTSISFILSIFLMVRKNYDVIHVHNPPDTLFAIGLFWKLFGKKLIFDQHDLSPDLYAEKYNRQQSFIYRVLLFFEKLSCKAADIVISTNESYKNIEKERCKVDENKLFVVRNGPNLNRLKISEPFEEFKKNGTTNLGYLGLINSQDGVDNVIHALNHIVHSYNYSDIHLIIIGDGDYRYRIEEISDEYNLSSFITITGLIRDKNVLNQYLSSIDIFIDAAPKTFLNDNSTFIKHMEYLVFKKPVVSFALKESMFTLKESGIYVKPNDTKKMAESIIEVINDNEIKSYVEKHSARRVLDLEWNVVSLPLLEAYSQILRNK